MLKLYYFHARASKLLAHRCNFQRRASHSLRYTRNVRKMQTRKVQWACSKDRCCTGNYRTPSMRWKSLLFFTIIIKPYTCIYHGELLLGKLMCGIIIIFLREGSYCAVKNCRTKYIEANILLGRDYCYTFNLMVRIVTMELLQWCAAFCLSP